MTQVIDELQREMDAAARALDFEEAKRLRDRINLIRGGASIAEAEAADTSGLMRQQPGSMGLGTSRQRFNTSSRLETALQARPNGVRSKSAEKTAHMMVEEASTTVVSLLADRGDGATICASEVARKLTDNSRPDGVKSWRDAMPIVHAAVDRLMHQGAVELSWKGKALALCSGPYRIGSASSASTHHTTSHRKYGSITDAAIFRARSSSIRPNLTEGGKDSRKIGMLSKTVALLALTLVAAPASAGSISDRIYPASRVPLSLSGLDPTAAIIVVTTTDGLRLNGIVAPPRGKPTLLIFHGNASRAADTIRWFAPLIAEGYGVIAAEYRGYSANPGKPDEAGLAADADAFFAIARAKAAGGPVWVVGHSLGGGVALGLARRQKLDAVITIGAFTRLRAVAPKVARAFVPDAYRNIEAVPLLDEPWFLIHGTADDVVPASEAKALYDAAAIAKTNGAAFVLKGAGHHPDGTMLAAIFAVIGRRLSTGTYDARSLPIEAQLVPFGATAPLDP